MYHFTTANGAEYTIANGRITRESLTPVRDRNGSDRTCTITDQPFRFRFRGLPTDRPTVGEPFRFTLKDGDLPVETGRVTFVSTGAYCVGCDTFGDLYGCGRTPELPSIAALLALASP